MPRTHRIPIAAVCAAALLATAAPALAASATAGPLASAAARTTTATPSAAATSTAPATPTATVPTRSYRADVDGDGRRDTVTIGSAREGTLRVSVRTVRGARSSIDIDQSDFGPLTPPRPFHGAADVDGVRGQELFVFYGQGAHTPWFKVLTWRSGRLFATREPLTRDTSWAPDGAYGYGTGYAVTGTGASRRLVITNAMRSGSRYRGTAVTFAWAASRWVKKGTRQVFFSEAVSGAVFGWHVRGIAVWPQW